MSKSVTKTARGRGTGKNVRNTGRNSKAQLLASCSFLASTLLFAAPAVAGGDVSIGGGAPVPLANDFVNPFAVYGFVVTDEVVNITSNHFNDIWINTQFAPAAAQGIVNVAAGVTVDDLTLFGVLLRTNVANVTTNMAGTIQSAGVGIQSDFGTTASTLADGKGTGTVNAASTAIALFTGTGNLTVQNFGGGINSTLSWGVQTVTAGNTVVSNNGPINSGLDGIWATSTLGNITVNQNGPIAAGETGVAAFTAGNGTVTISNNSTINGGFEGVWSTAANGPINILNNGKITGATWGVLTVTGAGDTNVIGNNGIVAGFDGVFATSATGNITVNANGDITAPQSGIAAFTGGGVTVNDNGTITAGTEPGIWTAAGLSPTSINGNGNITSTLDEGITATSLGGAINIGTVATNGVITGNTYGIYADAAGAGNVAIKVDKNVTGTTIDGILAHSVTGNLQVDVLSPAVVAGGLHGVTISTLGAGVVTNTGTIQQIGDTGAAGIGGGNAIWSPFGKNVVNNDAGGKIIGTIFTGGESFTLNNNAGGTWTPGSNAANILNAFTLNDAVNNSGLINTRDGRTTLTNLGNLNNQSGGLIDMTYAGTAPKATDALDVVNFNALGGSKVKFDVNFNQSNSIGTEGLANDHSSTGKGTADTIVVFGKASPQGKSTVDLATVGTAPVGSSGSIALVNAVAAGLPDPGPGGFATMVASGHYIFAADPSTGAVVYRLVEDSNGGVHLQWAPNLSATSLGGFGGTVGVGAISPTSTTTGGASESAGASPGAAIASVSTAFGGIGGMGLSGGPTGGGAAGHIADLAAYSVVPADNIPGIPGTPDGGQAPHQGGSLKDDPGPAIASGCGGRRGHAAWGQGEASKYRFSGGNDGEAESMSGGLETDIGNVTGRDCDRISVGIFGFAGWSDTAWETGTANTNNQGVGGYIRLSSNTGFYGSLLGAWNSADQDLLNKVYGTTANKNSDGFSGVATIGRIMPIAPSTALDVRAFVGYGTLDSGGFTDSAGIVVSGSDDQLLTVGGSVGIHAALNAFTQGYIRGGAKWAQLDSSISSAGVTQTGNADEVSGSVEAGFVATASEGVQLGISGFGEFSETSDNYGGRAHLRVGF